MSYFPLHLQNIADDKKAFYTSLREANGTFKTTNSNRLDDVNVIACDAWERDGYKPNTFLDIGVSSGITTVEWFNFLRERNYKPKMVGTDISIKAKKVSILGWIESIYSNDRFLGHSVFGRTYHAGAEFRPFIKAFPTIVANLIAKLFLKYGNNVSDYNLLSDKAMRSSIIWKEEDVFRESQADNSKFDVVRVANLLNLCYFSKEKIMVAISNIKNKMLDGSMLIICMTHQDGSNHGCMYRMEYGRFSKSAVIGNGSELDDLIINK